MAFRTPFGRLAGQMSRRTFTTPKSTTCAGAPRFTARQQQSRFYSSEPPRARSDKIKFWPFIAIIAMGSGGYIFLVNKRKGTGEASSGLGMGAPGSSGQLAAPEKSTPTFSSKDVTVLFVLGGPGAGKGTQCSRLVKEHGFTHLSAGDLLRAEQQRPGSQFGDLIRDYIKNGLIVPMEVTVQLLENAMTESLQKSGSKQGRFLIDGFPRKMDQAHKFEESVCPAKLVLFYDCPEKVMESRLLERGKTSGRSDDNAESIRKRFRTFIDTSMPVIDYYEKIGKVIKVDATPTPDKVFAKTEELLTARLGSA